MAEEGRGHGRQRRRPVRGGDGQGHHGLRVLLGGHPAEDPAPRGRPGESRGSSSPSSESPGRTSRLSWQRAQPAARRGRAGRRKAIPSRAAAPLPPGSDTRSACPHPVAGIKSSPLARKIAQDKGHRPPRRERLGTRRKDRPAGPGGACIRRGGRHRQRSAAAPLLQPGPGDEVIPVSRMRQVIATPALGVHVHGAALLPHRGRGHGRAPGGAHPAERRAREEDFGECVPHGHFGARTCAAPAGELDVERGDAPAASDGGHRAGRGAPGRPDHTRGARLRAQGHRGHRHGARRPRRAGPGREARAARNTPGRRSPSAISARRASTSSPPSSTRPGSAILAVGAVRKEPVVENDAVVIRQRMRVTLSCDHRIIDGAMGAAFLRELADMLENPLLALA